MTSIAAGSHHTVGLRHDGSVLAVGANEFGQCEVGQWKDVVAIAAGAAHTVALPSDGRFVATGSDADGQCRVDTWARH